MGIGRSFDDCSGAIYSADDAFTYLENCENLVFSKAVRICKLEKFLGCTLFLDAEDDPNSDFYIFCNNRVFGESDIEKYILDNPITESEDQATLLSFSEFLREANKKKEIIKSGYNFFSNENDEYFND